MRSAFCAMSDKAQQVFIAENALTIMQYFAR